MLFVALFCDFCETGLSPVAYRRFIYDETTKLGFGLSQQERLALQWGSDGDPPLTTIIKTKSKDSEDSLTQQVAALTQLMQQLVRDSKGREIGARADRNCPWDGCATMVLKEYNL
ncbi:hypothetical protein F5877DRAFT_70763 [Lentinula edodes]|nr:hypothetical protein F5877DRAFT_70763 [Lentinula edodes]